MFAVSDWTNIPPPTVIVFILGPTTSSNKWTVSESYDSGLSGGLLPGRGGEGSTEDQLWDWKAAPSGQEGLPTGIQTPLAG